ncbi:transmembrane protein 255B [Alosa pseudoharengus]|uniref:transmembrane protein 255B n=1 Tax=Alosa pseudoharengus TaxID=34774 RepID=UPI003F8A213E
MQPQPTPPVPPGTGASDPAEYYLKRRRAALGCTLALLALSLVVLTIGLVASTRTDNVAVAGFYPGIILSFGSFLGILGIKLMENRRPMLIAAIIFISLGIKSCLFCAIIDGVIAAEFLDIRPLIQGRCSFYSSGVDHEYGNYYGGTEVTCQSYNKRCELRVKANSCYCCDLYNCESSDYQERYYEFVGVRGCWDVVHLHRLLWASVVLNVTGIFLGITTAAILGGFKNVSPDPPQASLTPNPPPPLAPPHMLYNPTQHLVTYPRFCPPGQALPVYPNYSIPMQHQNGCLHPANSTVPQPHSEDSTAPLEETQLHDQNPSYPPNPSTASQANPSGYMLTPNAPALYAQPCGMFEKPPPYAC